MKAAELKKFLKEYRKTYETGQAWIDSIPKDINSAFYDNMYVTTLEVNNGRLMKALFGDLYEDISWFLYEWDPKRGKIDMEDGVKYNIKSLDDYIVYLVNEGLVEV